MDLFVQVTLLLAFPTIVLVSSVRVRQLRRHRGCPRSNREQAEDGVKRNAQVSRRLGV